MRRAGWIIVTAGLLIIALVAGQFVRGWTQAGPLARPTTIVIPEGTSLTGAAVLMKRAGMIRSADAFVLRAGLFGGGAPVKAGEYRVPRGASNAELLRILQGGAVVNYLVTIPEGMPAVMVRDRLMAKADLAGPVAVPPEGSVLPDSYAYEKGEPRAAVLARMQRAMDRFLAAAWEKRGPLAVVKSPREALILASIVEKETSIPAERPTVAGVYGNRLRIGMPLQADPTIIYPITAGRPLGRRIRRSEILQRNDYNTYAMSGLPRGPIANPSRSSIEAVLNPARTRALYFVADGKGGHIFADTLAEHEANVRKWFEIRRARGEM
jgi:UPF0755 protein